MVIWARLLLKLSQLISCFYSNLKIDWLLRRNNSSTLLLAISEGKLISILFLFCVLVSTQGNKELLNLFINFGLLRRIISTHTIYFGKLSSSEFCTHIFVFNVFFKKFHLNFHQWGKFQEFQSIKICGISQIIHSNTCFPY
jgi:hypothetical protein